MKFHLLIVGAVLSPALLANPTVRDAATHEQLAAKLQKAEQTNPMPAVTREQLAAKRQKAEQTDPTKSLTPATGEDASKVNPPQSLLSRSDVLAFGGHATLVPKRAILHIPENLKGRMGLRDDVRLLPWRQFYAVNRGWITTFEVSRPQAAGNVELGEAILNQIGKGTNVIVATYRGGPISVLPLKQPEVESATNVK